MDRAGQRVGELHREKAALVDRAAEAQACVQEESQAHVKALAVAGEAASALQEEVAALEASNAALRTEAESSRETFEMAKQELHAKVAVLEEDALALAAQNTVSDNHDMILPLYIYPHESATAQ